MLVLAVAAVQRYRRSAGSEDLTREVFVLSTRFPNKLSVASVNSSFTVVERCPPLMIWLEGFPIPRLRTYSTTTNH